MAPADAPYTIENGWLFGLKWSTAGMLLSLSVLGGCALFDVDENKERHNQVYGEMKKPKLNPQAPTAQPAAPNASEQPAPANTTAPMAAPAPQAASANAAPTPYDLYNSEESLNAAPPAPVSSASPFAAPVAPQSAPIAPAPATTSAAAPTLSPAAPTALTAPAPQPVTQARKLPKENKPLLQEAALSLQEPSNMAVQEIGAPQPTEISVYHAPSQPVGQLSPTYNTVTPVYEPAPIAQPLETDSAATMVPVEPTSFEGENIVMPSAPPVLYAPMTPPAGMAAPTPVAPVALNDPAALSNGDGYLPQSRYAPRRNMYRRVNAY